VLSYYRRNKTISKARPWPSNENPSSCGVCVSKGLLHACPMPSLVFATLNIKVALLSSTPLHSVPFLFLLLLAINPPGFKNRDNLRTSDPRVLVTHQN
jgi:hypothetical protein